MDAHETLEEVMNVVESTLDVIESTPQVVKNNPVVLAGVAVISLAVGASVATVIANKRLKLKYEALAETEIQEAKVFYLKKAKAENGPADIAEGHYAEDFWDGDKKTEKINVDPKAVHAIIEAAEELAEKQGYVSYDKASKPDKVATEIQEVEVKASIKRNIFDGRNTNEDDYDLDDELEKRADGKPYIIEKDNFFENQPNHSQTTLTYFEGDDTLVDEVEPDKPIDDPTRIIGIDNLKFGRGSEDKNVVYIRNDRMGGDYEVTRSFGKYSVEVLGLPDYDAEELKHSDSPRKFRDYH